VTIGGHESDVPYIPQDQRRELDPHVDRLADAIRSLLDGQTSGQDNVKIAGALNYAITRLLLTSAKPARYHDIAILTGVLENVKQEFYRKFAAPYEDGKIEENGPVY